MVDLKKILNPDDQEVINTSNTINWVPKEPAQVLLPYIEATEVDKTSIGYRKNKTNEIVKKYSEVINKCRVLEGVIESRCKDVSIPISRKTNLRVVEAMQRVFGTGQTEITFEHYKRCIEALAKINNNIPTMSD